MGIACITWCMARWGLVHSFCWTLMGPVPLPKRLLPAQPPKRNSVNNSMSYKLGRFFNDAATFALYRPELFFFTILANPFSDCLQGVYRHVSQRACGELRFVFRRIAALLV